MPEEVAQVPAGRLESREITADGGKKKHPLRGRLLENQHQNNSSPADRWRGWKFDQASVKH